MKNDEQDRGSIDDATPEEWNRASAAARAEDAENAPQPEEDARPVAYRPSDAAVRKACDLLDKIKGAYGHWGGWSATPSACDEAINLLRYSDATTPQPATRAVPAVPPPLVGMESPDATLLDACNASMRAKTEPKRLTAEDVRTVAIGWEPLPEDASERFMAEVFAELQRARAKFPGDRIMTIALAEEFGELCKAILDEPSANVWKEAVQTAVMAARVAIDGDSSVDEWRAAKGLDNHRAFGKENDAATAKEP